jgi:hypothetical protein
LHKNEYTNALHWCKTVEDQFHLSCIQGVGMQTMKEHITSPKFVESVCMQEKNQIREACIVGMMTLYMNHFGRTHEAQTICPTLETSNQKLCKEIIAEQKTFYQK